MDELGKKLIKDKMGAKIDEMVAEFVIKFVNCENDHARVEPDAPTNETESEEILATVNLEENWDIDEECQHLDQLSVQPSYNGVNDEEMKTISEMPEDPESLEKCSRGLLRFSVKIENFEAFYIRQAKVTSESFQCRTIPFSLIVMIKNEESLGLFLKRSETDDNIMDTGLDIMAQCALSIVDQISGEKITKTFPKNIFRAGSDWGFSDFISINNLRNNGYVHNDCIIIEVEVSAEPPYCYSNNSKMITGYVGIRNQGATCYMNSLLQVLFHLPMFRQACYRIPTEMDTNSSMALALQKVFHTLQFSDTALCTKNLTKSFGWSSVDVLMQHDIQEMMRLLIEKVERRMKNTLLEPILPSMFQGKFISYVKCRDIEFSSQREEVFYDIQLSLENANNVYDSFKQYVSPEMMDDDNKYDAGNFGLQAAEKGTLFVSLPPVLFLHLLRFQFDATTNQVVKNNNFYEFYDHIDLTEFVQKDDTTPAKYTLFAVLSHYGSGSHGHYVAYINPLLSGNWLKFDDDTISLVHRCDAIDSNFGSEKEVDECTKSINLNAYLLLYIRDSDIAEIFAPIDPGYITDELENAVKVDRDQEYCNYSNRNFFTSDIYIFLDELLESDIRFEASKVERPMVTPKFAVTRDTTANEFKKMLQSVFNIRSCNQMRIWPILHSNNSNSKPIFMNENDSVVATLAECRDRFRCYCPFTCWLEMALPGCELPPFDQEKDALVFYYYYCNTRCRPCYIHYGYHGKDTTISELVPILNQLMNWSNRELNIYKELREDRVLELNSSNYLSDYMNEQCDITLGMNIIFEPKEHNETMKLNSICLYYIDMAFRINVTFWTEDDKRIEEHFNVSMETTFPELVNLLAVRVNHDPKKLQIFKCQSRRDARGEAVPSTSTETLSILLDCESRESRRNMCMFFKKLQVDVSDVESKHHFKFRFNHHQTYNHLETKKTFSLFISDDETIDSILVAAKKLIHPDFQGSKDGSGKFRILYVTENPHRVKILHDSKQIVNCMDNATTKKKYFRIEEIPMGDDVLNVNEKYVTIHPSTYPHLRNPGSAFIMKLNLNEEWASVKLKIKERCRMYLSDWEDYRPVVLIRDEDEVDIDDTKCINDCEPIIGPNFTIGLFHNHKMKIKRDFESNTNNFNTIS